MSGFTIRGLKLFDSYKNINDMNDITFKEYLTTYYTYINTDLLLSITCNCIPDIMSWLNQAIPKGLIERFFLFEKHPFENLSIKHFVITNFLVKVLKHKRNRRNGVFNKIFFKKLFKESNNITEILQQDFKFIQVNEFRNQLQPQRYFYLLFSLAKLFLFNMEFSPYVYDGKFIPLNKYIKIKTVSTNIDSSLENKQHHNNERNVGEKDIYDNNLIFLTENYNKDFQKKYQQICLLENIKYSGFNYKLYNESEKSLNDDEDENKKDEDDTKFLDIPLPISNINYKNCYRICYEIVERATFIIQEINDELKQSKVYPYYLCIVFYHFGLFYMSIYANFKEEKVKENIEFYQEQIEIMCRYFPFVSYYYLKIYKNAKKEAYLAFQDDSIIFYPRELI